MHKQNTLTAREAEKQEVVRDDSLGGQSCMLKLTQLFPFSLLLSLIAFLFFLKKLRLSIKINHYKKDDCRLASLLRFVGNKYFSCTKPGLILFKGRCNY